MRKELMKELKKLVAIHDKLIALDADQSAKEFLSLAIHKLAQSLNL